MRFETTIARAKDVAAFGCDADGAALLDDDFLHRRIGFDRDAESPAGLRHRLRDRAHAADGMAPCALLAVHFAKDMMQQHIGGAGRVGARVIADDAVETIRRLDRRTLEPAVEIVASRLREQREQVAPRRHVKFANGLPCDAALSISGMADIHPPSVTFGGVTQQQAAHQIGDFFKPLAIRLKHLGVAVREFGDAFLGAIAAGLEIFAVIQRQEVLQLALDHAQAVTGEVHVRDDLRIKQRDGVARNRIAETGMEFLRHRCAANNATALQDGHLHPRTREIERANEPVMARPDDDGVGSVHGTSAISRTSRARHRRRRIPVRAGAWSGRQRSAPGGPRASGPDSAKWPQAARPAHA